MINERYIKVIIDFITNEFEEYSIQLFDHEIEKRIKYCNAEIFIYLITVINKRKMLDFVTIYLNISQMSTEKL